MCGIAGLIGPTLDPATLERLALAMADTLAHRGPDDSGVVVAEPGGFAFGHRRLSIVDLSAEGAQPMTSRSGRWVIAFNGEVYNHRALRAELMSRGVRFRGHSDTETLVEAIDAWGIETTLRRSNSMFAFAALDRTEHRLVLARDRLGEKPLYWLDDGDRFAFASELRGLRVLPGVNLRVDPAAATALLHWSFVPHPFSIYEGVHQLAPGHLLEARLVGGRVQVDEREWWSLADVARRGITDRGHASVGQAAEEARELLSDAVALRMESDVPLGSFLSGGMDSSLVAAFAQQALGATRLRTFTVSMPDLGLDEAPHARAVAAHLDTDHQTVKLSRREALDQIPRLASIWDEPFADPSMLPTALLCRTAREHLTVCLAGDGGDEVFAGYNRHIFGASLQRRFGRLPSPLRHGLGRLSRWPSPSTVDAAARLLPARARVPQLGDKVQKAGSMLLDDDSAWEVLAGVWPKAALGVAPHAPAVPRVRGLDDPVERMLLADTAAVLPDQMLVKVDRASMAASLEVRSPYVDHRLVEWAWRQPLSVKASGGRGKLVLRELGKGLLPPEINQRPKFGFDPPLAGWLRDKLRPWASDLMAHPRCVEEGWINGDAVAQAWNEHLAGRRNWEYRLWGVLMLESWLTEHHPR